MSDKFPESQRARAEPILTLPFVSGGGPGPPH